ncbi:hypothetical protein MRB53_039941 [Persea americana]|nr:hypothetical protein MRB53_039941 [Persea americana]
MGCVPLRCGLTRAESWSNHAPELRDQQVGELGRSVPATLLPVNASEMVPKPDPFRSQAAAATASTKEAAVWVACRWSSGDGVSAAAGHRRRGRRAQDDDIIETPSYQVGQEQRLLQVSPSRNPSLTGLILILHSRFQVKYKRRRSGKTDYYARKRLITQAKNKYNAPKYRLVVRFTNKDIITQIVTSEITGDKVFAAAYAHELKRYGITHGLTNWAAAYATGLLLARRTLAKLKLDEAFTGVEEPDGEFKLTEEEEVDGETRRPFKAFLDVGLARTSTGARVFGALKGASDGGIYVPHSEKRFPGYDIESKELDAETLRKYIYAGHVAEYMETLADDDEERYKSQFEGYIDDEIEADGLEELYTDAHKQIREDPFKKAEDEEPKKSKEHWKAESLKYKQVKLTHAQRKQRVQEKIQALVSES